MTSSKLKGLRVIVLCEDIVHHRFIRNYLICQGISKRNIQDFGTVKSRNNASVFQHYPDLVKVYRARKNYQDIALVVMLDADERNIKDHLKEFDKRLDPEKARLNQKAREDDEKIAIFIPARNIETWIHYIFGHTDCNEHDDYKRLYSPEDAKKAARKLAEEICPEGLPEDALPSLHHACRELERLQK